MAGSHTLAVQPLTREAFAPFGEVIDTERAERFLINNGTTTRFHRLAHVELDGTNASAIINLFRGDPFEPPISIAMMERHPWGSQAFVAMGSNPWLAVVAPDIGGVPGHPQAFVVSGGRPLGVNYARNVWHHPLLALQRQSDFLVVDRLGEEKNLEEYSYPVPYSIASLDVS